MRLSLAPFHLLCVFVLSGVLSGMALGSSAGPSGPADRASFSTVDSLRTMGKFRAALARLDELSQQERNTVEVLWRQSILWADLGKEASSESRSLTFYRQALAVAEEALSADPSHGWAHASKALAAGRVASLTNSTKKSVQLSRTVKKHADRAIQVDSTLAAAYYIRARWHCEVANLNLIQRMVVKTAYGGLPDASYDRAVRDFQEAIRLETRTYHHLELGKTYRQMGDRDAARRQFRIALSIPRADPFNPEYKREARKYLAKLD